MNYRTDEHLRSFVKRLNGEIQKYGHGVERYKDLQKVQVETLVKLEKDFKKALLAHQWGKPVYKDFISYICDYKKNILAARPFFRERQTLFTAKISQAFKDRSIENLSKYHVNFQFIAFAMKARPWGQKSEVRRLFNQIQALRAELIETNLPLVINRARLFWSKTPRSQLSHMDLMQISCEGLMSAIDKYCLPYSKVFRAVIIGRITGNLIQEYCVSADTILLTSDNHIKMIKDFVPGDKVFGVDQNGQKIETEVVKLHDHGTLEGYEITFDDGYSLVCSKDHKFLTSTGMVAIKDIVDLGLEVLCASATNTAQPNVYHDLSLYPASYSTSPLSCTDSLVRRQVVGFKSVGQRQMYDLEVSHPKHNFLLPNGIVTSNSETLVHFYPNDKRKIYRANKVVHKHKDGGIDFEALAAEINQEASREYVTTPSEIADLMAAASLISSESGSEDEILKGGILGRCEAPMSVQPDVCVEQSDLLENLSKNIGKLSHLEQKLLKLKGVHF